MDLMTTSNLLKNTNKALEPFLKKIGSELGELASDQLRYIRWKAATKILKRAKYFCESHHIPLKQIPLKFLLPFIEGASLEDVEKPGLVDMWASLLISRLNKEDARAFLFINILRSLSSAEAKEVSKLARRIAKKKDSLLISDDDFDLDDWNITDFEEFSEALKQQSLAWRFKVKHSAKNSMYEISPSPDDVLRRYLEQWPMTREDMFFDIFGWSYYCKQEFYGGTQDRFQHKTISGDTIQSLFVIGLLERRVFQIKIPIQNEIDSYLLIYARLNCFKSIGLEFVRTTHFDLFTKAKASITNKAVS